MNISYSAHCLAAHGWPEQALASLVQLGEDDVLGLVGRRLCREVDHDWLVSFFWKLVQNEILLEKKNMTNYNTSATCIYVGNTSNHTHYI